MQRPSGISLSDLFAICREDPANRWLWIRLYLRDLLARVVILAFMAIGAAGSPMAWAGRSPTASCRPLRPTRSSSASRNRHDLARRPGCLCAPGDGLDGRLVGRSRGRSGRWASRLRRRTDPRISRRPGAIGGTTEDGPGHQRGSFPAPGPAGRQRPTNYSGASPCPGRNRC